MTEIALKIDDDLLQRIQAESERLNIPLDDMIHSALAQHFRHDEPTKAQLLQELRESFIDAIHGNTRPIEALLAEVRAEMDSDADAN